MTPNYTLKNAEKIIMRTVLLVEDDPFLVDIYTTKFQAEGFSISVATDGNQAISRLLQDKPEVLLLDIVLPKVDGWEILKSIKQNKDLQDLKVIVLSNLGQKADIDKAIALGATRYLIKAHYTPSEVVEEVKKIIG